MMPLYSLISISVFFLLYCFAVPISTINILNSLPQITYISFGLLVFAISLSVHIPKKIVSVMVGMVCLVSGGLFFLHLLFPALFSFLKPDAFQFIIPVGEGHNHLGDLVGLGLVSSLIFPFPSIIGVCIITIYLLILIVTFSKSAFLATFITFYFLLIKKRRSAIITILVITTTVITVAMYTKEFSYIQPLDKLQTYMSKVLHLTPKPLFSSRDLYFIQASKSWITTSLDHSFFGYGPGNFIYASKKSADYVWHETSEAHNLLLTFFMESGPLPTFWFIVFLALTIYVGVQTNNPITFLFLYLFINFQTDYTYRIPLFFFFFFFFSGQIFAPLLKKGGKKMVSIFIVAFAITTSLFGISTLYINHNYKTLMSQLDKLALTNKKELFAATAQKLETYTPYDEAFLIQLSIYNEQFNVNESIRLLEKLSVYSPHKYLTLLSHQLDLQIKENVNIKKYLDSRKKMFSTFPYSQKEKDQLNMICMIYTKTKCISSP
jgi:hypothetical protein